jgi:hypothetical protein
VLGDLQCLQDGSVKTRTQEQQHLGEPLASHLPLGNRLPQPIKGQCDEVFIALQAARSLAAWMLMKLGQDGLCQALMERCPGLQIAMCANIVQQLQARDFKCLADILPHGVAPSVPI